MFAIDLKSRKPISRQIIDNIKELIVSGVLAEDEKLPSVREMASYLTVNPNTVQKAFRILEQQGYIYMSPGRGTFVQSGAVKTHTHVEELETINHLEESLMKPNLEQTGDANLQSQHPEQSQRDLGRADGCGP